GYSSISRWAPRMEELRGDGLALGRRACFPLARPALVNCEVNGAGGTLRLGAKANTIGRFLNPMEGHHFTIFFYIPVLFLGFFPWSGFLPITLYQTLRDWYQVRRSAHQPDPARTSDLELFAALWVIGVFVFFTISS